MEDTYLNTKQYTDYPVKSANLVRSEWLCPYFVRICSIQTLPNTEIRIYQGLSPLAEDSCGAQRRREGAARAMAQRTGPWRCAC